VKLKSGVESKSVSPALWWALGIADKVYRLSSVVELVVTALTDGEHKTTSLHYSRNSPDGLGRAADLRTRGLDAVSGALIFNRLRSELVPHGFDVVNEGDHFHIEFDPKDGRAFPWGIDGHTSPNTTS
jgi:hypothetical protein